MRTIQELNKTKIITCIITMLISVAAFFVSGYIRYPEDLFRMSFFALFGFSIALPIFFIQCNGAFRGSQFIYIIIFIISNGLVFAANFYDYSLIPVLGIYSLFYVVSDDEIALLSIIEILALIAVHNDAFIYLLIYIPAIILLNKFLKASEHSIIVLSILACSFFAAFLYTGYILAISDDLKPADIVFPVMGLILSIIICIVTLYTFRRHNINKYDDIVAKINDPEYYLMLELKAKSPDEYKLAIHTAYLCDRICSLLDYDRVLGKCLGYYHRIGIIREGKISNNTVIIARDNDFPPVLLEALESYSLTGKKYPESNELSVLLFCYEVIRSILTFNKKYPDREANYDSIIDKVFEVMQINETMKFSKMQLCDQYRMKQYLKDEKLYYDFLR